MVQIMARLQVIIRTHAGLLLPPNGEGYVFISIVLQVCLLVCLFVC